MQEVQEPKAPATHVVIVDDDPIVRSLIAGHLGNEFDRISEAGSAAELERILATTPVDVVLLDIMLPDRDGFTITRELRGKSNIGIILVSKRNDDYDRILGLELGADDYVSKPFVPRELVARVKTVLRRITSGRDTNDLSPVVRFDEWSLDLGSRLLTAPGAEPTRLTSGEFILLSTFIQKPGALFARKRLASLIGSDGEQGNERSVDVLISRLRRKLRDDPSDPRYIVTVHKEGYIFVAPVY